MSFSWRFRIRALGIVVAIVALALSWMLRAVHRQQWAVRKIRAGGGEVQYDFQFNTGGKSVASTSPPWLLRTLGHDYFHEVWSVHLNWPECGEDFSPQEMVALIEALPELRRLRLGRADDSTLAAAGRLSHLEQLDLYCAGKVTDAGVFSLSALQNLRSLQLVDAGISDAAMTPIAQCGALDTLMLENAPAVTDRGMEALAQHAQLAHLTLTNCQVTKVGLATLSQMPTLVAIRATGPHVTVRDINDASRTLMRRHPLAGGDLRLLLYPDEGDR